MNKKLYNTYSVGDELTLFEIDRRVINKKEYLLLLQKQSPNLIVVGFFDEGKLEIVNNRAINAELLKVFMENRNEFFDRLKPFIDFSTLKTARA